MASVTPNTIDLANGLAKLTWSASGGTWSATILPHECRALLDALETPETGTVDKKECCQEASLVGPPTGATGPTHLIPIEVDESVPTGTVKVVYAPREKFNEVLEKLERINRELDDILASL